MWVLDSFPWPFSAIFSKPVPHLKFKVLLTLRSRKVSNTLCLLGRSRQIWKRRIHTGSYGRKISEILPSVESQRKRG